MRGMGYEGVDCTGTLVTLYDKNLVLNPPTMSVEVSKRALAKGTARDLEYFEK